MSVKQKPPDNQKVNMHMRNAHVSDLILAHFLDVGSLTRQPFKILYNRFLSRLTIYINLNQLRFIGEDEPVEVSKHFIQNRVFAIPWYYSREFTHTFWRIEAVG